MRVNADLPLMLTKNIINWPVGANYKLANQSPQHSQDSSPASESLSFDIQWLIAAVIPLQLFTLAIYSVISLANLMFLTTIFYLHSLQLL